MPRSATALLMCAAAVLASCAPGSGTVTQGASTSSGGVSGGVGSSELGGSSQSALGGSSSSLGTTSTSIGQGPKACGSVTARGQCSDAGVLTFCSEPTNTLQEVDCVNGFAPGVTASCLLISEAYGSDCALPTGSACGPVVTDETQAGGMAAAFCAEPGAGCQVTLEEPDAGARTLCSPGMGTCDAQMRCAGNAAVLACRQGQVLAVECVMGTCVDGTCEGSAGAPCSTAVSSVRSCAAPLTCVNGLCAP